MSQTILKDLEQEVYNNPESLYYYKIENQINEITKTLRNIRMKKNITQIEIAKKTGLSKQMISKIEVDNSNPTLSTLVKYCDCIGVNLPELILSELIKQSLLNNTNKGNESYE